MSAFKPTDTMYKKDINTQLLYKEATTSHRLPTGVTRDLATDYLRTPHVVVPTKETLMETNRKWELGIPEYELEKYRDVIAKLLVNYDRLDEYPEPTPEVQFPRTPGTVMRPKEQGNLHNGWFVKTDIRGTDSGKLKGKKIVIKDNIPVAGVRMRAGSKLMEGFVPEYDATVVRKVLEEGGLIKGKANCEDLTNSCNSFTCITGPVLNAVDKTRSAGGSSSGPAVLVALGEADMALGTDMGGHLRIPAAWNGIVGMKPTWGLIPFTGILSKEPTLEHVGPLGKTVMDCATMLEALAIRDRDQFDNFCDIRQPRDITKPQDIEILPTKITDKLTGDIKGMKVGLIREAFMGCEQDVETTVKNAAKMLTKAGAASVEEVSIPMHNDAEAIFLPIEIDGVFDTLFKKCGVPMLPRGFHPTQLLDFLARTTKQRTHDLTLTGKLVILLGEYLREKYGGCFYSKAQNLTRLLKSEYDEALKKFDILICPTTKFKATKLPTWTGEEKDRTPELLELLSQSVNSMTNTCPFNLTGHPAITIDAGKSENLPIGMQIIGKEFDDITILRAAHAFEKVRGF